MLRVLRAVLPLVLLPVFIALTGCSDLYRPVYSPGKSNYKKPPEKREAAETLLPPDAGTGSHSGTVPPPSAPPAGGAAPAPAPGLLDAPPPIPGLPQ